MTKPEGSCGWVLAWTPLRVLALYYLLQGLVLVLVGLGGLTLLHQDHERIVHQWLHAVRADPDSRYLHVLLAQLPFVDDRQLEEMSAGTLVYGGVAFLQGGGLLLGRRWASYLTVVAIASFIPVEVYAIWHHATAWRLTTLGFNCLIVWYLLRQEIKVG